MPDLDEIPYNWNFYDLDTLINTRPDGYIARVTFYIQGEKESRILLTPVNTYKVESDPVYEFRNRINYSQYFLLFSLLFIYNIILFYIRISLR